MRIPILGAALALGLAATAAASDLPTFEDYLEEMNWTEVTFSGYVYYAPSGGGSNFTFLQEEGRSTYGAVIDAGREARERIESQCRTNSFSINRNQTCRIEGSGSVEIRNSMLYLSIENITRFEAPEQ